MAALQICVHISMHHAQALHNDQVGFERNVKPCWVWVVLLIRSWQKAPLGPALYLGCLAPDCMHCDETQRWHWTQYLSVLWLSSICHADKNVASARQSCKMLTQTISGDKPTLYLAGAFVLMILEELRLHQQDAGCGFPECIRPTARRQRFLVLHSWQDKDPSPSRCWPSKCKICSQDNPSQHVDC